MREVDLSRSPSFFERSESVLYDDSFCDILDDHLKDAIASSSEETESEDYGETFFGSEKLDAIIKKFETLRESDPGYLVCMEEMTKEYDRLDLEWKKRFEEECQNISTMISDLSFSLGFS